MASNKVKRSSRDSPSEHQTEQHCLTGTTPFRIVQNVHCAIVHNTKINEGFVASETIHCSTHTHVVINAFVMFFGVLSLLAFNFSAISFSSLRFLRHFVHRSCFPPPVFICFPQNMTFFVDSDFLHSVTMRCSTAFLLFSCAAWGVTVCSNYNLEKAYHTMTHSLMTSTHLWLGYFQSCSTFAEDDKRDMRLDRLKSFFEIIRERKK